MLRTQLPQALG